MINVWQFKRRQKCHKSASQETRKFALFPRTRHKKYKLWPQDQVTTEGSVADFHPIKANFQSQIHDDLKWCEPHYSSLTQISIAFCSTLLSPPRVLLSLIIQLGASTEHRDRGMGLCWWIVLRTGARKKNLYDLNIKSSHLIRDSVINSDATHSPFLANTSSCRGDLQ